MKLFKTGYQPEKITEKPFPPKVKPEKPISSQSVKLTLDETGLKDAIGNLVTSFETKLNNDVEVTTMITKPKYIVKSKTPGVPIRYCETKLEAEHYKDLQSTWGYELEIIEPQSLTNHTQPQDLVNHPAHYTRGKVETIDGLESAVEGLQGKEAGLTWQIMKYMWRWKFKDNPLQDLKKAEFYLKRLINYVEVGE